MRLLGIDSGSKTCGYAVWDNSTGEWAIVRYGTVKVRERLGLCRRLRRIRQAFKAIVVEENIDIVAIEQLVHFAFKNVAQILGPIIGTLMEMTWAVTKREAVLVHPQHVIQHAGTIVAKRDVAHIAKKKRKKALQLLAAQRLVGPELTQQDEADAVLVGYIGTRSVVPAGVDHG